jgi:hypothetical protein
MPMVSPYSPILRSWKELDWGDSERLLRMYPGSLTSLKNIHKKLECKMTIDHTHFAAKTIEYLARNRLLV